jgi:hypothetical protein
MTTLNRAVNKEGSVAVKQLREVAVKLAVKDYDVLNDKDKGLAQEGAKAIGLDTVYNPPLVANAKGLGESSWRSFSKNDSVVKHGTVESGAWMT